MAREAKRDGREKHKKSQESRLIDTSFSRSEASFHLLYFSCLFAFFVAIPPRPSPADDCGRFPGAIEFRKISLPYSEDDRMAKRDNHYEAAFEAWLRARKIPYLAV